MENFMVANETKAGPEDDTKLKGKNYLVQNCAVCKQEMQLGAGSITFEGKWYHKDCYDSIPKSVNRNLIEDF